MTHTCKMHGPRVLALALTLGAAAIGASGCKKDDPSAPSAVPSGAPGVTVAALTVTSTAFAPNGSIPAKYTCEADGTSPPLAWSDPPPATKSFAIVVDDPDAPDPSAPKQTYVHWVLYDLAAATRLLPEGQKTAPADARDGKNDAGKVGWTPPCPPIGRHRYFFKVYALDAVLADLQQPVKADLVSAMNGHVLGEGELIGTYQKGK